MATGANSIDSMRDIFHKVAATVSYLAGTGMAFVMAMSVIVVWGVSGPVFGFSDTWQLVINTSTTIVTFLMVFLIQNTQNRDGKALQLKLDELIRASRSARDSFIDLEDMDDDELAALNSEFQQVHQHSRKHPAMHNLHKKIAAEHQRRRSN